MRRTRSDRGAVLLVVFVLIVMMSLAAYSFLLSMETEHLATATQGDQLTMHQAALSARDLLASVLRLSRADRQAWGPLEDNPELFAGRALWEDEARPDAEAGVRLYVVQPPSAATSEADDRQPRFGASNESAKLHLGQLALWDQQQPGVGRTALMRLSGMNEATADALLDWVDADQTPREQGAESDYYASVRSPVSARNGLPVEVEELLYVRGVDARRLLGASRLPLSQVGVRPVEGARNLPPSAGDARFSGADDFSRPWIDDLTLYSAERNESSTGVPRIFVNTAKLSELHAKLSEVLPVECANFIVLFRQFGPAAVGGTSVSADQVTMDFTVKEGYPIDNLLDLAEATVVVPQGDKSQLVASPFVAQGLGPDSPVARLLDVATVWPDARLTGRINVNLARKEILLAVPGMTEELAERILAARTMASGGVVPGRDSEVWLWTEGLVDRIKMRELLPYITAGGDVYRADCWGTMPGRAVPWGCEIVLDASDPVPRQVYYRELPSAQFVIPPTDARPASSPTSTSLTPPTNRSGA